MRILNFFYENPHKFELAYERKVKITSAYTLLKGPKYCGKKTLIFNYLSQFKSDEILFLDLKDLRFEEESLNNLPSFLQKNTKIKILCLYNLENHISLKNINIPIILSTNKKDLKIEGFQELELDYFDFEEFLSMSKNITSNHSLGLFLNYGRSNLNNQMLRDNFTALELEILKYLACNLGNQISITKLFQNLKNKIKTSKDSVYKSIKKLENEYVIYKVEHDSKALKKIYFQDFAFKNSFCIEKDFKKLFENLILNELFKFKEDIYFNKFFTFYLKKSKIAFIASPTLDIDLLKLKAKKILPKALELDIFHIFFITLSNEENFFEQGVKFEILPFDKWALSF
ncbi:ATP-binding protein [Campylobacter novaezeelandiae]|uniref:ATP-binding protein n=1 Tax=Campylobacter novaezeelandiae TaxID=2267891 RepID=UPI0019031EB1|nr:ATP-binding protein [Campylobacter novaezeelandiae]MBK1964467.1 ATP-binding protein [Campylobacter novaezeelandiae]